MVLHHDQGRFSLHDLLRAYAVEPSGGQESGRARVSAGFRLLSYYLCNAHAAAKVLNQHRSPIVATAVPSNLRHVIRQDFPGWDDAWSWFSTEESAVYAAVMKAVQDGLVAYAWQLVWTMADFLDRRGRWQDLMVAAQTALEAAEGTGDLLGQAHSRSIAARAHARLGRYEEALGGLSAALDLFCQLGDQPNQAYVHRGLAGVLEWQGKNADALRHDEKAVQLYRQVADEPGEASALNSMGWCHAQMGAYGQALDCCNQALALHRKTGNRHGEASTLDSLGYIHHSSGNHRLAVALHTQAFEFFRELGDRYYEADSLDHLGDALRAVGDLEAADSAWHASLEILDELDHPGANTLRTKVRR